MAQRIRQRADADLQGAAIADQRARMQADREVGVRHRLPRQREQLRRWAGQVDHRIEPVRIDRCGAAEPRQRRVDLRDQQRPWQSRCYDRLDRIEGQVRIAAQRQPRASWFERDFLHQHVHAAIGHRARGEGVVEARIATLRRPRVQQRAGLDVELLDRDVGRQCIADFRIDPCQAREIRAELAREERIEKARRERVRRARRRQRKRRADREMDRRIRGDARVDGVQQPVRLADAERRTHHDALADPREQEFHGRVEVVEMGRNRAGRDHFKSIARTA